MLDLDALESLAKAAAQGPWVECGHDRGGCTCGFVWSIPADAPIAEVTIGTWGDRYPAIRVSDGKPEAYMEGIDYGEVSEAVGKANAAFIAAANPETVLELIRLVRSKPVS